MRAIVAVLLFVSAVHAALWGVLQDKQEAPDFKGLLPSVSYSPFEPGHTVDNLVDPDRIRADLKQLATVTRAIRLYSSTEGNELVPPIAAELGLKVTLGIWIDDRKERNEREIDAAIDLARRNSNVIGIVVGNETIYRGEQIPIENLGLPPESGEPERILLEEAQRLRDAEAQPEGDSKRADALKWAIAENNVQRLIRLVQRVKKSVNGVPVTTGEIWNIWRDHPALASNVDFIGAHVLPYWERFSSAEAVDQAVDRYQLLRNQYPGKRVMLAEFGWPSAGYNILNADPGPFQQAKVLRNFVARANSIDMEYNIVEGIDRPWKYFEGGVGPYWGILNASLEPKFSWTGPIVYPHYWNLAIIALLVGILLSLPILRLPDPTMQQALILSATANGVGAWIATVFAFWNTHYFIFGSAFALTLGLTLLVPLTLIAMARIEEIAAVGFGRPPKRLLIKGKTMPVMPEGVPYPKISIHVPAYFEPPEMLKQTLDALARLDYPNYECVIIINNTPDPAFWQPIQDHCRALGERFKFINAEKVKGFKAGALRIAMDRTAADAEIIGIIDADYVVEPDWLKDLVPAFADPRVGLVQAPQDHRDEDLSLMHYIMNGEYAGFFDIGMVQRNEENAIIVHGTMCLIRRAAMDMAGGWSSDTICEDTDLGLAIQELGWLTHYTNHRYGQGLLPDTYEAFKKQRHRWAYGGFQIVKKHWRRFLPGGASRLTPEQKREFSLGWLNWLGAESLGVLVAILNLIWVPIVAFADIAIPDKILTLPIIAAFVVSLGHFLVMYRLRVPVKTGQMLGAMIAAMSVQWTVCRAVAQGLITEHLPFARTSKGGLSSMSIEFQAFWEAVIGVLLLAGAAVLVATNTKQIREIYIFAVVLVLESLPFLSAVALATLELSRANSFAFWRNTAVRTAELIGLRPVTLPVAPSQRVGSEVRRDG
jgi:cellulose synthase/poly-beta-1,6-N-acetylglucosamine synthase-like glycosyltransferase/exo-beta-1,3-glucanase (GH17 family)